VSIIQLFAWVETHASLRVEDAGGLRRDQLVAEKVQLSGNAGKEHTPGAKALEDYAAFKPGINPWPTARSSFSARRRELKPGVPVGSLQIARTETRIQGRDCERGEADSAGVAERY
jgi:hypothetical protein